MTVMIKKPAWLLPFFVLVVAGVLRAQDYSFSYYSMQELPDAGIYLPAPPSFMGTSFADDFQQWIWGKSVRNTPRGKMASLDSQWRMDRTAEIFGEALGITISEKDTPAIWNFVLHTGNTGYTSVVAAKKRYMRIRPFALMNEHVAGEFDDEEGLRNDGSYPSGHTAMGWSMALGIAEMAPDRQNEVLRRGYQYGESRVIVGAHWQSDVEAARLASSAAYACMHNSPEFQEELAAAKAEYRKIKGKTSAVKGYPDGEKIMDVPPSPDDSRFYGDVAYYMLAKAERGTARGQQAVVDAECSDMALRNAFSSSLGLTVSPKETPCLAELVAYAAQVLKTEAERMKATNFRKRPFVQMGGEPLITHDTVDKKDTSSYPSVTSAMGWGVALVLVEVAPDRQNSILSRGYEYGRSGVIAGSHYASDMQAGCLLAAWVYAELHNDKEFCRLMERAKAEYARIR